MPYQSNKLRTAFEIVREIKNWPVAWALRINRTQPGLRLLHFRNGLNLHCRGGTRDWDVIHELLFAQSYGKALDYLSGIERPASVLDLGGNIGLFSLLAAKANPKMTIRTFEPGPPNLRLLQMNCLANPHYAQRIRIHPYGVSGVTSTMRWHFDAANPGGSSLFSGSSDGTEVLIRSFAEIVEDAGEISLVKVDIEGAEYEIVREAPTEIWRKIPAISIELHHDPQHRMTNDELLDRMKSFGYSIASEKVCSYFLKR